ncbi:MAG: glycosyltransferase family A protein [Candidatus Poseidoniaceae archaeon]|nr:glycosyltransferase family A protein [Candidatus Poseidoniaceae archaeon]
MTLVSITVCVRNGNNWIDDCMESLVNQTHSPLEIIIVDDGSNDGSTETVRKWGEEELVTAITQEPLGLSAGRMAALEVARGEWVAITDIDVRPEPDWIEQLLLASPSQEDEEVVAVTGRTVFGQSNDVVSIIRSIEIQAKYRSRPRRTSLANGPCSMFNREKLLEVGGFDPSWYHAEDMEVSLRLIAEGGVIIYAPDAVVNHIPETGLTRFLSKRKRDSRAHVRIVRNYPARNRRGPGFDFIGSSWIILSLLPAWLSMIAGFVFLLKDGFDIDNIKNEIITVSEPVWLFLPIMIWWLLSLRTTLFIAAKKSPLKAPWIFVAWSLALWQGIILGCLDALFGRNGH